MEDNNNKSYIQRFLESQSAPVRSTLLGLIQAADEGLTAGLGEEAAKYFTGNKEKVRQWEEFKKKNSTANTIGGVAGFVGSMLNPFGLITKGINALGRSGKVGVAAAKTADALASGEVASRALDKVAPNAMKALKGNSPLRESIVRNAVNTAPVAALAEKNRSDIEREDFNSANAIGNTVLGTGIGTGLNKLGNVLKKWAINRNAIDVLKQQGYDKDVLNKMMGGNDPKIIKKNLEKIQAIVSDIDKRGSLDENIKDLSNVKNYLGAIIEPSSRKQLDVNLKLGKNQQAMKNELKNNIDYNLSDDDVVSRQDNILKFFNDIESTGQSGEKLSRNLNNIKSFDILREVQDNVNDYLRNLKTYGKQGMILRDALKKDIDSLMITPKGDNIEKLKQLNNKILETEKIIKDANLDQTIIDVENVKNKMESRSEAIENQGVNEDVNTPQEGNSDEVNFFDQEHSNTDQIQQTENTQGAYNETGKPEDRYTQQQLDDINEIMREDSNYDYEPNHEEIQQNRENIIEENLKQGSDQQVENINEGSNQKVEYLDKVLDDKIEEIKRNINSKKIRDRIDQQEIRTRILNKVGLENVNDYTKIIDGILDSINYNVSKTKQITGLSTLRKTLRRNFKEQINGKVNNKEEFITEQADQVVNNNDAVNDGINQDQFINEVNEHADQVVGNSETVDKAKEEIKETAKKIFTPLATKREKIEESIKRLETEGYTLDKLNQLYSKFDSIKATTATELALNNKVKNAIVETVNNKLAKALKNEDVREQVKQQLKLFDKYELIDLDNIEFNGIDAYRKVGGFIEALKDANKNKMNPADERSKGLAFGVVNSLNDIAFLIVHYGIRNKQVLKVVRDAKEETSRIPQEITSKLDFQYEDEDKPIKEENDILVSKIKPEDRGTIKEIKETGRPDVIVFMGDINRILGKQNRGNIDYEQAKNLKEVFDSRKEYSNASKQWNQERRNEILQTNKELKVLRDDTYALGKIRDIIKDINESSTLKKNTGISGVANNITTLGRTAIDTKETLDKIKALKRHIKNLSIRSDRLNEILNDDNLLYNELGLYDTNKVYRREKLQDLMNREILPGYDRIMKIIGSEYGKTIPIQDYIIEE